MQLPNFTAYEFLNAGVFTSGFGAVSGTLASMMSGLAFPGLVAPTGLTLAATGLAVTVTAPSPFSVLFGNGALAGASGVTTGLVSNVYAVNFSGQVPGSGSVTAYLLVSGFSIQEGAYQVVGPPPGHPDYNPLFVPSTAYNTNVDSLTFVTSTTAPDNFTTFEIARTTLAAAATGVTLNTNFQVRASLSVAATQIVAASGAMNLATLGIHVRNRTFQFAVSGSIALPPVSGYNGVEMSFSNTTSGQIGVTANGSDVILGVSTTTGSSTSVTVGAYSQVTLLGQLGSWMVKSVSLSMAAAPPFGLTYAGIFTSGFTVQAGFMYDVDTTAGSFSGTYSGTLNVADTFGINRVGTNLFTLNWASNGGTAGSKYLGDPSATPWYTEGILFFRWSGTNRGFG